MTLTSTIRNANALSGLLLVLFLVAHLGGLISALGAPVDYSVAKAAVIALAQNLARKVAPKVRVNVIAPGNIFFPGGSWNEKVKAQPDAVLLIDTVGDLEEVYCLADVAFVGGTLVEHGGQNMLEPAAVGKAVIHGPNVDNFVQESRLLQGAGASVLIETPAELGSAIAGLLADESKRADMGERAREAILGQRGATAATLSALGALLPKAGSEGPHLG